MAEAGSYSLIWTTLSTGNRVGSRREDVVRDASRGTNCHARKWIFGGEAPVDASKLCDNLLNL